MPIVIIRIQLPAAGIDQVVAEAQAEGYDFVHVLVDDWATGTNRFDGPGETLCGAYDQGTLVAVGGLNVDPFAQDPQVARVRRVFVRRAWRNQGIGGMLVTALVDHARTHFRLARLRAENADAARLYERMGWTPMDDPDATHILNL